MQPVCRIEIVIDAPHSDQVLELLAAAGLRGFTLIRGVTGGGERGLQYGDEVTGVSSNHYILTTCPPEGLADVTAALRPLLKRTGGMCLVSDARWLKH